MINPHDRRNFDRLKTLNFKIEYSPLGSESLFNVEVVNISAGGICFLRDSFIRVGEHLNIMFPFKSRDVVLDGIVLRFDGREVALKFLNSEEELEKFVETFNAEYVQHFKKVRDGKLERLIRSTSPAVGRNPQDNMFDIDD
jgi:hypothetical protein